MVYTIIIYRARNESCSGPSSKACREKMRRDKMNDRFAYVVLIILSLLVSQCAKVYAWLTRMVAFLILPICWSYAFVKVTDRGFSQIFWLW